MYLWMEEVRAVAAAGNFVVDVGGVLVLISVAVVGKVAVLVVQIAVEVALELVVVVVEKVVECLLAAVAVVVDLAAAVQIAEAGVDAAAGTAGWE